MSGSPPPITPHPSPPPDATSPFHTAPPPPSDPQVAELHIMFPSVDPTVISLILESSHGSTDRAIEQLLQMTDPEFKPDELHGVRHEEQSQLDLDAQFARSLQMQDEHDLRQTLPPPPSATGDDGELPYQPRVRRTRGVGGQEDQGDYHSRYQAQRGGENPPGMLALEDKIEKYAEVGKQTFNSLFSKAKAKYSEFQATSIAERDQPGRPRESAWGQRVSNERDQGWRQPTTPTPGGGRGGQQDRQGRGMYGDGASFSSRSESFSSESTTDPTPLQQPITPQAVPLRQNSGRWQPTDAFDDPLPPARTLSASSPSKRIDVGGRRSPVVGSPGVGSPGAGSYGSPDKMTGKIDPAKLGILPKKRVDLLSTSPSPPSANRINRGPSPSPIVSTPNGDNDDDDPNPSIPSAPKSLVSQIPKTPPSASPYKLEDSDDELEYTRNPFDER